MIARDELPLMELVAPCGFPSPATDSREEHIQLSSYLVDHPYNTFCVRASGDSMSGAHIVHGDILLVDRQLRPRSGDIVLAVYDGAFVVKRLLHKEGKLLLHPENPAYKDLRVLYGEDLVISGVVIAVVRKIVR